MAGFSDATFEVNIDVKPTRQLRGLCDVHELHTSGFRDQLLARLKTFYNKRAVDAQSPRPVRELALTAKSSVSDLKAACKATGAYCTGMDTQAELYACYMGVPLTCDSPPLQCTKPWQLRAHCISRGIGTGGKLVDLQKRVKLFDERQADEADEADEVENPVPEPVAVPLHSGGSSGSSGSGGSSGGLDIIEQINLMGGEMTELKLHNLLKERKIDELEVKLAKAERTIEMYYQRSRAAASAASAAAAPVAAPVAAPAAPAPFGVPPAMFRK